MNVLKYLCKTICDDLKDGEMLIDYAKELRSSYKSLSESYASDAKNRLQHSQQMLKELTKIVEEMIGTSANDSLASELWQMIASHYAEWQEKLDLCIKKY